MNKELYNVVLEQLNKSLYAGHIGEGELDGEVVEEYVADFAESHDLITKYADNWGANVVDTSKALCEHFNVEYDTGRYYA